LLVSRAAWLGLAWGLLSTLPLALLMAASTRAGFFLGLGIEPQVAQHLADTGRFAAGALCRAPLHLPAWICADTDRLWFASLGFGCASAILAIVLWGLLRAAPVDRGALSWRSLIWALRACVNWRFAALLLCLVSLFIAKWAVERSAGVRVSYLFPMVGAGLLALLQLTQPVAVKGAQIGAWWRVRPVTWRQGLFFVLSWAVIGVLVWVVDDSFALTTFVGLAGQAVTTHALLRHDWAEGRVTLWRQLKAVNLFRWSLQYVWICVLAVPLASLVIAVSWFNIYLAPVFTQLLGQTSGAAPLWWAPWSTLSVVFAQYWWVAVIAWGLPFSMLLNARLAWQEITCGETT
jgi:hypothetical protein